MISVDPPFPERLFFSGEDHAITAKPRTNRVRGFNNYFNNYLSIRSISSICLMRFQRLVRLMPRSRAMALRLLG